MDFDILGREIYCWIISFPKLFLLLLYSKEMTFPYSRII